MAGRTEHHQAVEVEVRAPLGALDEVVDLEGAPAAIDLAPPAGAPDHCPSDVCLDLQGLERQQAGRSFQGPESGVTGRLAGVSGIARFIRSPRGLGRATARAMLLRVDRMRLPPPAHAHRDLSGPSAERDSALGARSVGGTPR